MIPTRLFEGIRFMILVLCTVHVSLSCHVDLNLELWKDVKELSMLFVEVIIPTL